MRSSLKIQSILVLALSIEGAFGCGEATSSAGNPGTPGQPDPGGAPPIRIADPLPPPPDPLPPLDVPGAAEINKQLAEVRDLSADGFAARYRVPFSTGPSYDPLAAQGLSLIQSSPVALNDAEQSALKSHGFMISERRRFPTFFYGYETIYAADLPLYVSADSILYAVHRSYDTVLKSIELANLIPSLDGLLASMRSALANGAAPGLGGDARRDADLYLAVALSLLKGAVQAPVAGADAEALGEFVDAAMRAEGSAAKTLFGVSRLMDFSQFSPRGHYLDSEELKRYFRAMMWLGRVDFRLIETLPNHTQVFHRRQLEASLGLRELIDQASMNVWSGIDRTIEAFVGEPDAMTLPELDSLLADLGVTDVAGLGPMPDIVIAQAIVSGGYGTQRIASHIMINGLGEGTLKLNSSFLLFGQRYVVDSHVFSNVVYDRVQGGSVYRMMPNPLDVGFAALGNSHAGQLLAPELAQFRYSPDLASMRILVDAHGQDYWEKNLYNLWLGAIRELSATSDVANPAAVGLPSIAGTEAWGRRLLSAQLASWAELRHDTLLYAKQSYTGGTTCEFPDAYVDPYPRFYARIETLARRGSELISTLDMDAQPGLKDAIAHWFGQLETIAHTLREMAEHQRSGAPHTQAHLDFINRAVRVQDGCGGPSSVEGWYGDLFFEPVKGAEFDPTIADVHTQPTDEGGNPVGRVLHVGTGMPRLLVVTADTCTGPRAYVGLVSSYFERVTENWQRLNDKQWSAELLQQGTPQDVPWMTELVTR